MDKSISHEIHPAGSHLHLNETIWAPLQKTNPNGYCVNDVNWCVLPWLQSDPVFARNLHEPHQAEIRRACLLRWDVSLSFSMITLNPNCALVSHVIPFSSCFYNPILAIFVRVFIVILQSFICCPTWYYRPLGNDSAVVTGTWPGTFGSGFQGSKEQLSWACHGNYHCFQFIALGFHFLHYSLNCFL